MKTESTLPLLRQVLLKRQRQMHARRRIEQSIVVTAIRDELGPLGDHPCIPYIVHARWPYATIDDPELPDNWIELAARWFRPVILQNRWGLESPGDVETFPEAALAPIGRLLRDVRKFAGIE